MTKRLEIVGRVLRSYGNQDVDGLELDIHPDVELDYSDSDAPDASVFRGRAACLAFVQGRYEDFADRSFEVLELIDAPPDAVIAVGRMRGIGRASRVTVDAHSFTLWTVRDSKIIRIKLFRTRDAALEAADLAGRHT
jgi:ketosteroid isomerase-like protein